MVELYELTPEQLQKLDLTALKPEEIRELAYFTWCFYPYDVELMTWREHHVLPLVEFSPELDVTDEDLEEDELG